MFLYIYNYIYNIYIYISLYIYLYIYMYYTYVNFWCHNKMMPIKILKSVFYNPFLNGVHFDFFCRLSSMLNLLNFKMFFNGDWLFVNFGCHKEMSMKIHIHNKMTLFSKWSIFCSFSKPSTFQSEMPFYCDYWER